MSDQQPSAGSDTPDQRPDATESITPIDATSEIPTSEPVADPDREAAWARASATEDELRSAHPTSAGPIPPIPPGGSPGVGAGAGDGSRIGSAWRSVWGSALGKVAVIGIAALATLAIVAAIGLAAFAHDRDGRGDRGRGGWSMGRGEMRGGDNDEQMPGQRNGQGQRKDKAAPPGLQKKQGTGSAAGSGGPGGLGDVLHGEVVIDGLSPRTMLYQVGEVTEFTAGQSLAVKSSDGFAATYALTNDTKGSADGLTVGATVRVIADKDGAKATRVQVVKASANR